ncbi:MAG: hypothetical protein COA79_18240 [Planctomycetota bacterium]|nr:MAG: hypothetical protein COA79_18240 [Planctomycetota bacterium]
MKIVSIQRLTFEPKEVADLKVENDQIVAGRVGNSLNEGDIKGFELIKHLNEPIDAISIGSLDAITLVHTFVRGAENVYEVGEQLSKENTEAHNAAIVASKINSIDGVELIVCGDVEQDTGRSLFAGLLASKLGWDLFTNIIKVDKQDSSLVITQETEAGLQNFELMGPAIICPDESCSEGDDPSDAYDLIEKLEKKESVKVKVDNKVDSSREKLSLEEPKGSESQAVVSLDGTAVKNVLDLIKNYSN